MDGRKRTNGEKRGGIIPLPPVPGSATESMPPLALCG